MKIESTDTDIRNLLLSGFFYIPRFQRPYSWDKDNVLDFWEDLVRDTAQPYFIGPMVLYKEGSQRFGIVDGQQRLTTITILLCVLRQEMYSQGFTDFADALHQLVERQTLDAKNQYVLTAETSYPYFQNSIQRKQPDPAYVPDQSEEFAIRNAYESLKQWLSDWIVDILQSASISASVKQERVSKRLLELREAILNLRVVKIVLDDEDDAYEIFETLNTKGKDLNLQDLVKTHFARKIPAQNEKSDDVKLKWEQLINRLDKENKSKKGDTESIVDTFLHHFWLSKYQYLPAKKIYKPLKSKSQKQPEARQLLQDLLDDAQRYRMIIRPMFADWSKNERTIFEHLRSVALFETTQHASFSLALIRAHKTNVLKRVKSVTEVLSAIESFTFMAMILAQRGGSGISQMYASSARALYESSGDANKAKVATRELIKKLAKRKPTEIDLKQGFARLIYTDNYDREKKFVRYALERLYAFANASVPVDFALMTIEHLLSQSEAKAMSIPDEIYGGLGNLILVPQQLNEKLANKPFIQKKQILIDSGYPLDKQIRDSTTWGVHEIQQRFEKLVTSGISKVWAY